MNLTGHKNVYVAYCSWFSWWYESSLCIYIGDPRFFLRVAATMNSKCFVKLSTVSNIEYDRKYEIKMTSITFKFIAYPSFEWVNWNTFRKSSLNFTFGRHEYFTFLGQTQAKLYCLKFEIAIFSNNLVRQFSSSDYSISRTDPGTLPHLKQEFWDKSECFSFFHCWDLSWMCQGFWMRFWTVRSLFCSMSRVAGY